MNSTHIRSLGVMGRLKKRFISERQFVLACLLIVRIFRELLFALCW
jgi:hypothetical protein